MSRWWPPSGAKSPSHLLLLLILLKALRNIFQNNDNKENKKKMKVSALRTREKGKQMPLMDSYTTVLVSSNERRGV